MTKLFATLGKFALFLVGMVFLTGVSLFVVGAYLATWPIMRVSPRDRRLTSLMGLATAVMATARAYNFDKPTKPATDDTEATDEASRARLDYPYEDGDTTVLGPGCFVSGDGSVINLDGRNYFIERGGE